jgi:pimeloyl-ACP methyl ester carboxylesterase
VNRKRFRTQINEVKSLALETPVQGIIAALGGMRDRPNRELLLKFPPYPVHLIAGEKDPRIPLQELIEQAEISEFVHLHVLEGCGHMSYIEDLPNTLRVFKEIL